MNKNKPLPLFRRSKTSILQPQDIEYFCHNIPILRNGYTTKSRASSKKSVVVTNTCAMDSVLAIYCSAYLDNEVTKNEINESTVLNRFSWFVKSFFTCEKRSIQHYKKRTELLLKIFTKETYPNAVTENNHVTNVVCMTGVAGFFEKLINLDGGQMSSVKRCQQCANCSYENISYSPFAPLRFSVVSDVRLDDIEQYVVLNDGNVVSECRGCGNNLSVSEEFKNIIAC